MKSSKNHRCKRIVIISLVVLAVVVFFWVLWSSKVGLSEQSPKEELSEQTLYRLECSRFDKVLKNASDDELFLVLRYAIAHNYVPNDVVDPYHDLYVGVSCWKRSLWVYGILANRKTDMLRQIYPDLQVLDEYVHWGLPDGSPYPDTVVAQTIMRNAQGEGPSLDSLMGDFSNKNSLCYRFFATPYLRFGY